MNKQDFWPDLAFSFLNTRSGYEIKKNGILDVLMTLSSFPLRYFIHVFECAHKQNAPSIVHDKVL